MRRLLAFVLGMVVLFLGAGSAGAQTVTVTADTKNILGTAQTTKVKMCMALVDTTGQAVGDAHVVGTGVLVPTQNVCVSPDNTGHISTTAYANDQVTAGGATDTTLYQVSWTYNGMPVAGATYHFLLADATENLNSKAPSNVTPLLTVTPTDNIYARLDGANMPFTNTVSITPTANNLDLLTETRFTDTLPTGSFLNFKSAALNTVFKVAANGDVTMVAPTSVTLQTGDFVFKNAGGTNFTYVTSQTTSSGIIVGSAHGLSDGSVSARLIGSGNALTTAAEMNDTIGLKVGSTGAMGFTSGVADITSLDGAFSRLGVASVAFGNGTPGDFSGTIKTTTFNAATGFQVNGVALAASNLSNGVTGSGHVVLDNTPTLITPNIGAATGTLTVSPSGVIDFSANGTATGVANFASSTLRFTSSYWTGSIAANDNVSVQTTPGSGANPTLDFVWTHGGTSGTTTFNTNGFNITSGTVVNAVNGFRVNSAATSGHVLRGNGTNFVDAALAAADLSNGVTGSGAVVLDTSPILVTPNIGAATATTISVSSANPAASGFIRMSSGDTLCFRNTANVGDACLSKSAGDDLILPSGKLQFSDGSTLSNSSGLSQLLDASSAFAGFEAKDLHADGTGALATGSVNVNGGIISSEGQVWNGAGSTSVLWQLQNQIAAGTNAASTLKLTYTGPGAAKVDFGGFNFSAAGFDLGTAATSGRYLRGNGSEFISSAVAAGGAGSCTNQVVTATNDNAVPTCSTVTSAFTSGTFPATAHALLSSTHSDTTAASPVRGDGIFAIGVTPTWQRLAHGATTGSYFKWNGTDIVASSLAAAGTGSPTACSNQFVTAFTLNGDAAPTSTCTTDVLASAQHANQGTTTTVLHGNAAGNPSFGAVNLATDTSGILPAASLPNPSATTLGGVESIAAVTHNFLTSISTSGVPAAAQPALADLSDSSSVVTLTGTQTTTNKRNTPRVVSMADATSVTPTSDTADQNTFASTQIAGTLTVNNPSGTPTDGQKLILRLHSTNAQTYAFGTAYAFSTSVTAPTTLSAGKTDYIGLIWDASSSKWDVVAYDGGH